MANKTDGIYVDKNRALECRWQTLTEAKGFHEEWCRLSKTALDATPFYEPNLLSASINHMRSDDDCQLLIIRDIESAKLVGLFPFDPCYIFGKFGKPYLRLHHTPYIMKSAPLIAHSDPKIVWETVLAAINQRSDILHLIELVEMTIDRPVAKALTELIDEQSLSSGILREYERALLDCNSNADGYGARRSKNKRKSLRQRLKKLQNAGDLSIATANSGSSEYPDFFEAFLNLEASGWKGKRKTAFASDENLLAYAKNAYCSFDKHPQSQIDLLKLDDVPIAANLSLISQNTLHAIKSAYDETHAEFAPGIMLDHLTTNSWLDEGKFKFADSCAQPESPLSDLWLEREKIQHILVSTNSTSESVPLKLLKGKFNAKQNLKIWVKKMLSR